RPLDATGLTDSSTATPETSSFAATSARSRRRHHHPVLDYPRWNLWRHPSTRPSTSYTTLRGLSPSPAGACWTTSNCAFATNKALRSGCTFSKSPDPRGLSASCAEESAVLRVDSQQPFGAVA